MQAADGKFFCLDEDCCDNCVAFPEIVSHMKQAGFCGAISAEYEGYFHDVSIDSVEQVTRYASLMRTLL